MATTTAPSPKRESAKQAILDRFSRLMDKAEKEMSVREFREAAKKSSEAIDRALTRRKKRSATA